METRSIVRGVRLSADKGRLVADMVRGKKLDQPINIIIGGGKVEPRIRLDSIFNTVINTSTSTIPTNPQVTPTVNIIVNGEVRSIDIISSTQATRAL